jgi:Uma2 family endonuclease
MPAEPPCLTFLLLESGERRPDKSVGEDLHKRQRFFETPPRLIGLYK